MISITSLGVKVMEYKNPSVNDNRAQAAHARPTKSSIPDGKKWVMVLIAILLVVVLFGAAWGVVKMATADAGIKKDKYQAVFLTNGQVYFCKLKSITELYVDCSDIYYLQVQQNVQPADKNAQQSQVSLAKLGSELHGPDDEMHINRDQVLFWENLKDDGKVVTAIHQNAKK